MSFSTTPKEIKTVRDLKNYLEQFPDDVDIVVPCQFASGEWCRPFIYFDASFTDDWHEGDKVKMKYKGQYDIWVTQICIEPEDFEIRENGENEIGTPGLH